MLCSFCICQGGQQNRRVWELLNWWWKQLIVPSFMEFKYQNDLKLWFLLSSNTVVRHYGSFYRSTPASCYSLSIIMLIMNLENVVHLISQGKWLVHQNKITAFMNDQSSISLAWPNAPYLYSFLMVEPISCEMVCLQYILKCRHRQASAHSLVKAGQYRAFSLTQCKRDYFISLLLSLLKSASVSLHSISSFMAPLGYQHLQCKIIVKDIRAKCKTH